MRDATLQEEIEEMLRLQTLELRNDRDARVRALAGVIANHSWDGLYQKSNCTLTAEECIARAARITDTLDRLPVPPAALEDS